MTDDDWKRDLLRRMLTRPIMYVLEGRTVVACKSAEEYVAKLRAGADGCATRVAEITFGHEAIGTVSVSTAFLGVDHSFMTGPPVVFETMVFGGHRNGEQWRCCTYDEAEAQHQMVVDLIKNEIQASLKELSGA